MGDEARDYLALMREKHVDTTEILRKLTAHDNEVKEADIHPDRLDELVKEREALIGKLAKKYGKVVSRNDSCSAMPICQAFGLTSTRPQPERTAVHRRVAEGIRRVTTGFRSLGKGDRHDVVLHGHEGTAYMTSRQAGRYPELTQRSRR